MNSKVPRPIPEQPAGGFDHAAAEIQIHQVESVQAEIDDVLLGSLRRIADEQDAPPIIVDDLARAAFETRNLDLQLASLIADSEGASELVRSVATEPRMVSFEAGEVSIELQLAHTDDGISVTGLVIGASGVVIVQTPTGSFEAPVDDAGWFGLQNVVGGAIRLRLNGVAGDGVVTEWITT